MWYIPGIRLPGNYDDTYLGVNMAVVAASVLLITSLQSMYSYWKKENIKEKIKLNLCRNIWAFCVC